MLSVDFDRLALKEGGTLLDLGSGGGRHSFEAMVRRERAVAVDLDESGLRGISEYAAGLCGSESSDLHKVEVLVADARNLPFKDDAFDSAICSEVLEHLDEELAVIEEIKRVTKPKAIVALTVPSFLPEVVNWSISKEYHSAKGGHVRIYTKSELTTLVKGVGFSVLGFARVHALHSPYWWIKSWVGVGKSSHPLASWYESWLVRDMFSPNPLMRAIEERTNWMLGKSLVVYLRNDKENDKENDKVEGAEG